MSYWAVLVLCLKVTLQQLDTNHITTTKLQTGKELQSNICTQVSLILFPFRQIPDYSHLPAAPLLINYPVELKVNLLQRVKVAALSQSQLHGKQDV